MIHEGNSSPRRLPIGAEIVSGGTHFRVWAPQRRQIDVELVASSGANRQVVHLGSERGGYFSGRVGGLRAGTRYGFRLDGAERAVADPASRFQPDGPEGLSRVVDPSAFHWTDADWPGISAKGQVVYEIHVGTFTPEGTWSAAADQLEELASAGMTVIEIMPVADFPGKFGWGYDGVNLFAPTRLYGEPDDFRRFVNRAHRVGLGVVLDVVYNHFGPLGNCLPEFSASYVSTRYKNDWGTSPNFDGDGSAGVREYMLANARYWIEEFHLDGLRFDATQSIFDASPEHILAALVKTARAAARGRSLFIVVENEPQNVRALRSPSAGGFGMDAAWNDDFHHAAIVRLTGHNEAYYSDYRGTVDELLAAVKRGYLYQGQRSQWQKQPRGTPTRGLPATAFIHFLQNHDQVANSASGARIDRLTSPGRLRAMTALWLLSPQTPLFFQGQEFAAGSPFLFFADNAPRQAQIVAQGRAGFLCQFPSLAGEEMRRQLPRPERPDTFERCRLDFRERTLHGPIYALHRDLLKLRREDPIFARQRADLLDGAALGPDCLAVRYFDDDAFDRLLVVNFGIDLSVSPASEPLLAPPAGCDWRLLWSSDRLEYGGCGPLSPKSDSGWTIRGETAVVLHAVRTANA